MKTPAKRLPKTETVKKLTSCLFVSSSKALLLPNTREFKLSFYWKQPLEYIENSRPVTLKKATHCPKINYLMAFNLAASSKRINIK